MIDRVSTMPTRTVLRTDRLPRPFMAALLLPLLLSWSASANAALPQSPAPGAAPASAPLVILVTHPREQVLRYYVTLVREGLLPSNNVQFVGIHHESETEDYSDGAAYLAREKIKNFSLRTLHCKLRAEDVFTTNACRQEFTDLAEHSAGIIFNGGPDIPPSIYHRPTLLTTVIETPHRHFFEISLLANLLGSARNKSIVPLLHNRPDYAIMAICVGMQSLNVADGGTLVQDIPSEIYGKHTVEQVEHSNPSTWHRSSYAAIDPEPNVAAGVFHPIHLTQRAPVALRMVMDSPPTQPAVLSIHHQAVNRVGVNYFVTATSVDGKVVEGIRHKTFENVVGWQFHPERSVLWDKNEVGRMNETDPDNNFAYTLMQKDARSKAFVVAVWHQFTHALEKSRDAQVHLAH